jgi:hypothetical protein
MKKRIVLAGILVLGLVAGSALYAKTDIGLKGVGGKIGWVDPEGGIKSTIAFGAVADLGKLSPQITLEGELLYWGKSYEEPGWKFTYSQIYISGIAKYYFNHKKGAQFEPYAGAGLGLIIGKAKTESPATEYWHGTSTDNSNTGLGIHFVGGAKYPFAKDKYGFAEARFSMGGDNADIFGFFAGVVFLLK